MKLLIASILAAASLCLAGCQAPPATGGQPVATGDNSRNALDWAGTYEGTLPCADCEGIRTVITLTDNGRYSLSETWLGRSADARRIEGSFVWNDAGNGITLDGIAAGARSTQFRVGENHLRQLDLNGEKIDGALAEHYVLSKSNASSDGLAGTHWILVELAGQAVGGDTERHFLRFGTDGRVQAKAGCNSMVGRYQAGGDTRIAFSQMAMTRMACPDMSLETALSNALEQADSYSLDGDRLSLNRARMAPLVRFRRQP